MTLAEKIRNMSDDEIARMLWWYSINCITSFLKYGGEHMKNFAEVNKWVRGEYDPNDIWLAGPEKNSPDEKGEGDAGTDMDSNC